MRTLQQPIKVVDDFFESPLLWRHFSLKQQYTTDEKATWPGVRSQPLNELNMNLFSSLASKLLQHVHDKTFFSFLKVNFASVDGSYNLGWMHNDEPMYNFASVIFLNPEPPKGSGLGFYTQVADANQNYNQQFFEELKADPKDRAKFIAHKEEQRSFYKQNMYVENVFNRCVMFPPHMWHSAEKYFGNNIDDSRLTITIFGIAK